MSVSFHLSSLISLFLSTELYALLLKTLRYNYLIFQTIYKVFCLHFNSIVHLFKRLFLTFLLLRCFLFHSWLTSSSFSFYCRWLVIHILFIYSMLICNEHIISLISGWKYCMYIESDKKQRHIHTWLGIGHIKYFSFWRAYFLFVTEQNREA